MLHATMIVPVGAFTPDLSRRVREAAFRTAQQREVVISLQSIRSCAWGALNELAESLHEAATPYPIRLTRVVPRTRALLHELGIENGWFIRDGDFRAAANIVIAR